VGTFLAPRPLPDRRTAVVAGGMLVALALPVFLLAGWRVEGWALGAGLWVVSQLAGIVLNKAGIGEPTLRGSGIVAFGMMARGIFLVLGLILLAVIEPELALAAALVYAAAYTLELALSLTLYFGGERRA
jgi:hypothetical protein